MNQIITSCMARKYATINDPEAKKIKIKELLLQKCILKAKKKLDEINSGSRSNGEILERKKVLIEQILGCREDQDQDHDFADLAANDAINRFFYKNITRGTSLLLGYLFIEDNNIYEASRQQESHTIDKKLFEKWLENIAGGDNNLSEILNKIKYTVSNYINDIQITHESVLFYRRNFFTKQYQLKISIKPVYQSNNPNLHHISSVPLAGLDCQKKITERIVDNIDLLSIKELRHLAISLGTPVNNTDIIKNKDKLFAHFSNFLNTTTDNNAALSPFFAFFVYRVAVKESRYDIIDQLLTSLKKPHLFDRSEEVLNIIIESLLMNCAFLASDLSVDMLCLILCHTKDYEKLVNIPPFKVVHIEKNNNWVLKLLQKIANGEVEVSNINGSRELPLGFIQVLTSLLKKLKNVCIDYDQYLEQYIFSIEQAGKNGYLSSSEVEQLLFLLNKQPENTMKNFDLSLDISLIAKDMFIIADNNSMIFKTILTNLIKTIADEKYNVTTLGYLLDMINQSKFLNQNILEIRKLIEAIAKSQIKLSDAYKGKLLNLFKGTAHIIDNSTFNSTFAFLIRLVLSGRFTQFDLLSGVININLYKMDDHNLNTIFFDNIIEHPIIFINILQYDEAFVKNYFAEMDNLTFNSWIDLSCKNFNKLSEGSTKFIRDEVLYPNLLRINMENLSNIFSDENYMKHFVEKLEYGEYNKKIIERLVHEINNKLLFDFIRSLLKNIDYKSVNAIRLVNKIVCENLPRIAPDDLASILSNKMYCKYFLNNLQDYKFHLRLLVLSQFPKPLLKYIHTIFMQNFNTSEFKMAMNYLIYFNLDLILSKNALEPLLANTTYYKSFIERLKNKGLVENYIAKLDNRKLNKIIESLLLNNYLPDHKNIIRQNLITPYRDRIDPKLLAKFPSLQITNVRLPMHLRIIA